MSKSKMLRNVLIVFFAVILGVSLFNVISILIKYKKADNTYAALQKEFVREIHIPSDTDSDVTESVAEEKNFSPISVDFDALLQKNADIVGWIYSPDTPISYPVVKAQDNEKYLYSDLNGDYLVSGTLFADFRNGEVGVDSNYIIYGHNMANTTMFGTLHRYKDPSYYNEHPKAFFLTPQGDFVIEFLAGAVVPETSDIYLLEPDKAVISDIMAKSTFISSAVLEENDMIITLSTCTHEFENARYVVIGKLVETDVEA